METHALPLDPDTMVTMGTQPLSSESNLRLDYLFRSDHLVTIRDFFAMSPELELLIRNQVVQVFAIVDANVIQGELRWRLGRREMRVTFLMASVLRTISDEYYEKAENSSNCQAERGNFNHGQSNHRRLSEPNC